jgi:ABC-type uncharacterized transport system substrate-binding protein
VDGTQVATLRPLIQRLVHHLASAHGRRLGAAYALDYLQGMPDGDLARRIEHYIRASSPDVIVTISTRAALAAKAAREAAGRKDLPLVFTVVSHPERDEYGPLIDPATQKGDQITGVSTSLVQNVVAFRNIMQYFKCAGGAAPVGHSISHPEYVSSRVARQTLTTEQDANIPLHLHDLPRNDAHAITESIRSLPAPEGRSCLLVTPSDVMFAYRSKVIEVAQGEKGMPTFFQQPECVQDTADERVSAVAAYGLTPDTIGREAAKLVHKVLRDPQAASRLPAVRPRNFEMWVNEAVARKLGLELTAACRAKASRIFPSSAPRAGGGAAARAARRKKAKKKMAAKTKATKVKSRNKSRRPKGGAPRRRTKGRRR